jgi:hypothetical protein
MTVETKLGENEAIVLTVRESDGRIVQWHQVSKSMVGLVPRLLGTIHVRADRPPFAEDRYLDLEAHGRRAHDSFEVAYSKEHPQGKPYQPPDPPVPLGPRPKLEEG